MVFQEKIQAGDSIENCDSTDDQESKTQMLISKSSPLIPWFLVTKLANMLTFKTVTDS
jgi:hypothetical protein